MAQTTEERVAKVEGILEELRTRLDRFEARLDRIESEIGQMRTELHHEMHTNFRWTMGTIILMWVTIICTVVFA